MLKSKSFKLKKNATNLNKEVHNINSLNKSNQSIKNTGDLLLPSSGKSLRKVYQNNIGITNIMKLNQSKFLKIL